MGVERRQWRKGRRQQRRRRQARRGGLGRRRPLRLRRQGQLGRHLRQERRRWLWRTRRQVCRGVACRRERQAGDERVGGQQSCGGVVRVRVGGRGGPGGSCMFFRFCAVIRHLAGSEAMFIVSLPPPSLFFLPPHFHFYRLPLSLPPFLSPANPLSACPSLPPSLSLHYSPNPFRPPALPSPTLHALIIVNKL